jgi:hypothetical protein
MAAGQSCVIEDAVSLHIKLRSFSWTYVFLILEDSPVPCILGADFLAFAKIRLDFSSSLYSFAFKPLCQYDVVSFGFSDQHYDVFPCSERALNDLVAYVSPLDTKVFWERALENLNKVRERVARRYNLERRQVRFQVGDLVLVKLHPQSSQALQRSAKIAKKWSDPLVIAKCLTL